MPLDNFLTHDRAEYSFTDEAESQRLTETSQFFDCGLLVLVLVLVSAV